MQLSLPIQIKKIAMQAILSLNKKHPYLFSFIIATSIICFILFYSNSLVLIENSTNIDRMEFINLDEIKSPKRVVRQEISSEEGEISQESPIERAKGVNDTANELDLAFYPSIAPPKLIGRLKKSYPKIAKDLNIDATVYLELKITPSGKVYRVSIVRVKLSKQLPIEKEKIISASFAKEARKMFIGRRFTPTIVNGKNVPIQMVQPLKFSLR